MQTHPVSSTANAYSSTAATHAGNAPAGAASTARPFSGVLGEAAENLKGLDEHNTDTLRRSVRGGER